MTITLRQESNARATTKNDVITFEEMDNNFIHFLDNGIIVVGDDSTGTTFKLSDTLKVAGTQNVSTTVSGDTLTITGPDLTSYLTAVSESDVTQHQSALAITESQISDLGTYLTNSPITVVGDDSTGTTFNSSETIKFTGSGGATVAVSGDTVTITAGGGGGGDTGDVVFQSTTMSAPTNSDLTVEANGTGNLYVTGNRINIASGGDITDYWDEAHWRGANMFYADNAYDGSYRIYSNASVTDITLDSTFSAESNSRVRNNYTVMSYDINGQDASGLDSPTYLAGQMIIVEPHNENTEADGKFPSATAIEAGIYNYNYSGRDTVLDQEQFGFRTFWEVDHDAGDFYDLGANFNAFYLSHIDVYGNGSLIDDDYGANLISHGSDVRWVNSDLARVRSYQEAVQRTTHSSGGTLTIDCGVGVGMMKRVILTSNITGFDFSNTDYGSGRAHSITLLLQQDGTGSRTVSFTDAGSNPGFLFCGGNKAIDSTANSITVVHLMSLQDAQGNNKWYWNVAPAYTA